jgi:UPF0755 protein
MTSMTTTAVREFQLKRRADYRSSPAPQQTPAGSRRAGSARGSPPASAAAAPADAPAGGAQAAERPTPDEQH